MTNTTKVFTLLICFAQYVGMDVSLSALLLYNRIISEVGVIIILRFYNLDLQFNNKTEVLQNGKLEAALYNVIHFGLLLFVP